MRKPELLTVTAFFVSIIIISGVVSVWVNMYVFPAVSTSNVATHVDKVLEVRVVDTDEYQGFMPSEFTAKAGDTIELKVTNDDHNARTPDPAANSHPIVVKGPGVSEGIPELNPGQTKSITFRVEEGTYKFYCTDSACDIHVYMIGTIEVTK